MNYMNNNDYVPDINDLVCDQKKLINENEDDDDDYMIQLHQKLAQTRELRKLNEQAVQTLNGRVRCLKEENQRTLAKINLTKKKTNDRMVSIEKKRSKSKEKLELEQKRAKDLNKQKQKNYNQKLEIKKGLVGAREKTIFQNQIKGQMSKMQKADIENIKKNNEINEKNMKKNKVEVIRSQSIQNNQRRKILEIEKKENLIKDLENKLIFEKQRNKELEIEINQMLEEENNVIERIKQTNEMQRKIIEDFEKTLGGGSFDLTGFVEGLSMGYNNNENISNNNNMINSDTIYNANDNINNEEKKDF